MTDALRLLKLAHRKIKNPKHWTQNAAARDCYDNLTLSTSSNASKWCVLGALQAIAFEQQVPLEEYTRATLALNAAAGEIISRYNDTHSHGEVMRCLERAIRDLVFDQRRLDGSG